MADNNNPDKFAHVKNADWKPRPASEYAGLSEEEQVHAVQEMIAHLDFLEEQLNGVLEEISNAIKGVKELRMEQEKQKDSE